MRPSENSPRYSVFLTKQADKDLAKLPHGDRSRVLDSIEALAHWPDHGQDVKKLVDVRPTTFRLRRGNWRARFEVRDDLRRILIRRVLPRPKTYS